MISFKEITEQKISETYNGLSQDLKDVLSSTDTSVVIETIAAKYQLDKEKIEMLIQLVGLVILGLATFEDMKIEMKEVLEINPQFIPPIADEIHQKIFKVPAAAPVAPPVDKYREPTIGPEVIDLRKTPPPPPPLIEAEPHKAPAPIPVPESLSKMPQVILRPSGLPPTDLPRDILDLRKDKGEF